jgi:uncharacterized protein with HEPN domain
MYKDVLVREILGQMLEAIAKITDGLLLPKYPAVDWKGVKGIRDIISHQSFDLDADSVFGVCKNHVPLLRSTIEAMLSHLEG